MSDLFSHRLPGAKAWSDRGSASVEYVLVTLVVIGVLFVPSDALAGQSVVGYLLDALRSFQAHTSVLLSLP